MIRLATLPFQKHQQQQKQSHHFSEQSIPTLHLIVAVGFLLLCISSRFSVYAEGPHCNQVGHGPQDIIMASGRINPKYTWYKRGHKTYVPVVLDPTYSHKEHSTIVGGLKEIQKKTCVEFDIYDDEYSLHGKDYVFITRTTKRGKSLYYIGRIGRGKQELGLPPGCITHRTAMHEMMHALGFRHEHIRHDRDDYVLIFWGNIKQGRESNFQKRSNDVSVGPYDYDSIMHYERKAFSKNGMDTITPLKNGVKIGVRQTMSHWDAKKINIMYGCHAGGGGGGHLSWSPEHDDYHDFNLIDGTLSLPKNASSSPPSSSEIEVAYDELDYDPGLNPSVGSDASPRDRHEGHNPRSFYPRDEYHHSGPEQNHFGRGNYHDDHHHNHNHNPHQSRYRNHDSHNQNNHNQHRDSGPFGHEDDGQFHPSHGSSFGTHAAPHHEQGNQHQQHPRSFLHFALDTYPDDGARRDHGENDRAISENDDFYDF